MSQRNRIRHKTALGARQVWTYVGLGVLTLATIAIAALAMSGFSLVTPPEYSPRATPQSAEATATTTPRAGIDEVRALVSGRSDLTVNVLGDSTGNDANEWVRLWAQDLASSGAKVELYTWDTESSAYPHDPLTIGSGKRRVIIWNGSIPGAPATGALPLLADLQPKDPQLVIFNYGHNVGKADTGPALGQILRASESRWGHATPAVATLQNPSSGERSAISEKQRVTVEVWAKNEGVPTIDVHAAFLAHDDWATSLLRDGLHPNEEGSKVWAATVRKALGPS